MPLIGRPARSRPLYWPPTSTASTEPVRLDAVPVRDSIDPDTTPPGGGACRLPRATAVPVRDELELGIRLGVREPESLPAREDEGGAEDVPSEPELVLPDEPDEPEEPDEPLEPEDPAGRGIAWAPARLGAASATATARQNVSRIDLAMAILLSSRLRAGLLQGLLLQLYCQWGFVAMRMAPAVRGPAGPGVSSGLALTSGRQYDANLDLK